MSEQAFTIRAPVPEDLLTVHGTTSPVIVVKSDGRLFWHGREVATDREFVECVRVILARVFPEPNV